MKTMLRSTTAVALTAALVPLATGCASMNNTQRGAVIGAAGGAAVGGVIGKAAGSTAKGAILGAAVGGVAGAVIGSRMDKQREELAGDLDNATVERVGEGILVTFDSGLLFDFDSDVVKGAAASNLSDLARSLQQYPESEVLIVGHTDATGSDNYNWGLSERRASAARRYLMSQGVGSDRIRTAGRGETEPVASNESVSGQAANRRVEVAIFASEEYRQEIIRRHGGQ
jgi:outer membrane protein OmpA-like peptidoglycan-associated protein